MTLAETIRKAVTQDDARLAGRIATSLRIKGWRYSEIAKFFNDATGINTPDFDALMYEADELTNRS